MFPADGPSTRRGDPPPRPEVTCLAFLPRGEEKAGEGLVCPPLPTALSAPRRKAGSTLFIRQAAEQPSRRRASVTADSRKLAPVSLVAWRPLRAYAPVAWLLWLLRHAPRPRLRSLVLGLVLSSPAARLCALARWCLLLALRAPP